MPAPQIQFTDPDGRPVSVAIDAQTAAVPGDVAGTTTIIAPDGTRTRVAGDYRDVQVRLQAAAARAHESGAFEQPNTPMS